MDFLDTLEALLGFEKPSDLEERICDECRGTEVIRIQCGCSFRMQFCPGCYVSDLEQRGKVDKELLIHKDQCVRGWPFYRIIALGMPRIP